MSKSKSNFRKYQEISREQIGNVIMPVYKSLTCLHLQYFLHFWSFCFSQKWERAGWMIKGVGANCARSNEVDQGSWGRGAAGQGPQGGGEEGPTSDT